MKQDKSAIDKIPLECSDFLATPNSVVREPIRHRRKLVCESTVIDTPMLNI